MAAIIDRNNVPSHLFSIPELDFSEDLFSEPLIGPWFRLGAQTINRRLDERGVENVVLRRSLLLPPDGFANIYGNVASIGNAMDHLGKPGGSLIHKDEHKVYRYTPFYRFEMELSSVIAEPLVFVRSTTLGAKLFINPDLLLFFKLEEKPANSGIWWDPPKGIEAVWQRVIDQDNLEIVEIRVEYLCKYLQARQMALLVGHYRDLRLFNPAQSTIGMFTEGDLTLGSPEQGVKALVGCWLRNDIPFVDPFLQRRLQLWFQITPSAIDLEDPWADQPSFDPYAFTLPTQVGPVAPARWAHLRHSAGRKFEGKVCDFMEPVCFRQEVLTKYEGASGFEVEDNGSVSCYHEWALRRSTQRLGNELLTSAIGDFAEGVPFHEWPHWKQYAVEPPSSESVAVLREEQTVPTAVNSMVQGLCELNTAFARLATSLGKTIPDPLWRGSLDSLAGRQLKWVYPVSAGEDEFLKRATLVSTLVIDALEPALLRRLLGAIDERLHQNNEVPPKTLGSRNLLQRVTLVALLIENFRPDTVAIPILVMQAEGEAESADPDLKAELEQLYERVRREFAPLAFLYELRGHSGVAHHPSMKKAGAAAVQLGLPNKGWHRADYLRLLTSVTGSVHQISKHLEDAAQVLGGH